VATGEHWSAYLSLAGTFIAAFMAMVLPFVPAGPRKARGFLAGLFLLLVSYNWGVFLTVTDGFRRVPHLMLVGSTLLFLLGPLLYLYGRSLAFPELPLRPRDLLHGMPFLVETACRLPFFLQSGQAKLAASPSGDPWDMTRNRLGSLVLMAMYVTALSRLRRRHEAALLERHSRLSGKHLTWLLWIAVGWGSIPASGCVSVLKSHLGMPLPHWLTWMEGQTGTWVGAITVLTAFLGLAMPSLSLGNAWRREEDDADAVPEAEPAVPAPVSEGDHEDRLLARVQAHMESHRPYLEPNLSLAGLARRLHMSPTALSRAVNGGLGVNFFTFVNRYRIQEAQRQLRDRSDSKTILEIAHTSGFASKSTFNEVFKRLCGMTPREYQAKPERCPGRPET
jgi:AraC-like DNA-binding protein